MPSGLLFNKERSTMKVTQEKMKEVCGAVWEFIGAVWWFILDYPGLIWTLAMLAPFIVLICVAICTDCLPYIGLTGVPLLFTALPLAIEYARNGRYAFYYDPIEVILWIAYIAIDIVQISLIGEMLLARC